MNSQEAERGRNRYPLHTHSIYMQCSQVSRESCGNQDCYTQILAKLLIVRPVRGERGDLLLHMKI